MSGQERRTPSVTWGPRRAQAFSGNIKSFSKLVSGLSTRVANLPSVPEAPESEETLDVLKLEHEALLVAEEELRAQLEELESGHVLMQAERRRFDHVFDGSPDGYLITDGFGTIQELNPAMAKLLGGAPRSFVRKPVPLYVDEQHRRSVRDFLSTFSGESSAELELVVVNHAGEESPCAVAISRMPRLSTHAGQTLFWRFRRLIASERAARIATATPSSASEDAVADLEQRWLRERDARERLETESRAKDRLIAMVSHDLRAPLHSMLSWAQLLRKSGAEEQLRRQAVAAIIRGGRTQSALLEDLLDMSRIAEGKLAMEMVPLDLTAVVHTAVEALTASAREVEVTLTWQLADHVTITGDTTRMQQVVTNLVANAIKFTPRGGSIHVALDRDGADALLRVRDTGKGIARDALFEIFDCFAQACRTDAREGIGLGLYITRHLVERHGGTIRADSEGPGAGAVFTVRLPTHEMALAAPSSISLPVATMGLLKLVLVTDDDDICEVVRSDLRRIAADAEISCVSLDGILSSALDADIVVVDVPADVARCAHLVRMARSAFDVPLIAISSFATAHEVQAILDAGFDVHLSKPFSTEELATTIRAALPCTLDRNA